MITRVTHIRLKDWVLVACLDFVPDKTSVSDAVRRTLETFILLLQKQNKIPTHSEEELEQILLANKLIEVKQEDEDLNLGELSFLMAQTQEVDDTPVPVKSRAVPDFAKIAQEAEDRINAASVPNVRQAFDMQTPEVMDSDEEIKFNLYLQSRRRFPELKRLAPKDRLIEQAGAMLMHPEKTTNDQLLFIAALEVTYSNLPHDLWGSERALDEIKKLISMHQDE